MQSIQSKANSSPPMIRSVDIENLFFTDDVRIEFAQGPITILFGPNGIGKSTILKTISTLLAQNPSEIDRLPLLAARITFVDGSRFEARRQRGENFRFFETNSNGEVHEISVEPRFHLPDLKTRFSMLANSQRVRRHFPGAHFPPHDPERPGHGSFHFAPFPERQTMRSCALVNTERLREQGEDGLARGGTTDTGRAVVETIRLRLARYIINARSASKDHADQIDYRFWQEVDRRLKSPPPMPTAEERQRLEQDVSTLIGRLNACALAAQHLNLTPLRHDSQEVAAIYDLFLQNLKEKTEFSLEHLAKLETLLDILNSQLVDKSAMLEERGRLVMRRIHDGAAIRLNSLSSGEQHLLVLTYKLLFETKPGGICLIDEPEISFHTMWQERFIDNLSRIAEISPQQFVIATHSPIVIGPHVDALRPIERVRRAGEA